MIDVLFLLYEIGRSPVLSGLFLSDRISIRKEILREVEKLIPHYVDEIRMGHIRMMRIDKTIFEDGEPRFEFEPTSKYAEKWASGW